MYEPRMRDVRRLLQKNPILQDRMIDVGILSSDRRARMVAHRAGVLRATGIPYDVRRAFPYSGYGDYEFDVPTRTEGDAYARFLVRLDEMDEAMRIIRQVRKQLDTPGPWQIADTKFAPPPKETIALSMEALIHQLQARLRVVPRAARRRLSSGRGPRGELGYYVVSNGDNRPWRVRTRPPSMYKPAGAQEDRRRRADRRHGRDDRLARPRLRRGRSLIARSGEEPKLPKPRKRGGARACYNKSGAPKAAFATKKLAERAIPRTTVGLAP